MSFEKPEDKRRDSLLSSYEGDGGDSEEDEILFGELDDEKENNGTNTQEDKRTDTEEANQRLDSYESTTEDTHTNNEPLFGTDEVQEIVADTFDEVSENFLDEVEDETEGGIVTQNEPDLTGPSEYDPEIYFHSSEDMSEVANESVELIVTSPPYNADWAYGSHDDQMDYQHEYIPMLADVFKECWRVLSPGGRLVINVPTLLRGGSSGGQAILSDIDTLLNEKVGMWGPDPRAFGVHHSEGTESTNPAYNSILECMNETEFVHREWITWNKGFNDAGMAPNGSFPRPWGILMNNMHEGVSVYQKPGERDVSEISDERIESSKINKWADDLCDDVWDISPVNHEFKHADSEDVPPFPEELVKRAISLWTYEDDTVLDPFLGRGTTCRVAKQLQRYSIGYELREEIKKDIERYVGVGQQTLF